MRITDTYNKLTPDPSQVAAQRGKVGTNDPASGQNTQAARYGAVKVTVSAKARALADAHSSSDLDEAKVAKLRLSVQSGSLRVDSAKIAERIVDGD